MRGSLWRRVKEDEGEAVDGGGHKNGADWRKLCTDGERLRCIIYSLTSSFNIYGHESGEGKGGVAWTS